MKKTIIFLSIIAVLILIVAFLFFKFTPTGREMLLKLECKEQPYEDTEYYWETEPYNDIEYYYENEPYTVCAGYSFWTGECNSWKTEYRKVRKSRTITKYRQVRKSRTITRYKEVCVKIWFWKKADYSENWLNYRELYNKKGERIR